jgi:hypothetical protein
MKIEDIAPYLSGVGFTLTSLDADDTGADDIAFSRSEELHDAIIKLFAHHSNTSQHQF